jgi:hypothetical protein
VSAKIAENIVKTKKIWLKHDSRDLTAKKLNFQGLNLKNRGLKPNKT